MRAAQVRPGPIEVGIWMPVTNAARFYGISPRSLRRWAEEGRLRTKERKEIDGVKGVLVWSEEVVELTLLRRARDGGRLPKTA